METNAVRDPRTKKIYGILEHIPVQKIGLAKHLDMLKRNIYKESDLIKEYSP